MGADGGGAAAAAVTAEQRAELAKQVADLEAQLAEKTKQLAEVAVPQPAPAAAKKKSSKGKALIDTDPVQGTRDFPPEEMRLRNWLFGEWRKVAKLFGFEEYDAPVLEAEALYTRKAGEEIVDQMYNFTTKGGHRVALRPEMTPTLARLVMQKGQSLLLPVKWFSIPQCWRYEAIVRGRRREHFQWNMDILGVSAVTAEAELIAAIVTFLSNVGITSADVGFKINSRKLLQTVLEKAGVPAEKFAPVCIIVDKIEKEPESAIREMLAEQGVSAEVVDTILKTLTLKSIDEIKSIVGDDSPVVKELDELFSLLRSYGCDEWVTFDATVVRGLAYYTGVVFECFAKKVKLRAICGGGRYDNLMLTYGHNKQIPACGFGFGDCVIVELLNELKLMPPLNPSVEDVVIPLNEAMRPHAIKVVQKLRAAGRSVDILMKGKGTKQAFSYADRVGARRAVLVAPSEWEQGKVVIKDLRRETAGHSDGDQGEAVAFESL